MQSILPLLPPDASAPDFRLLDMQGRSLGLAELSGPAGTALLFFASDWLKSDLRLLQAYAAVYSRFEQVGLAVAGVSSTNWEKLYLLSNRLQLPFPLLFDPCARVSKKYGALWIPKFITGQAIYALDPAGTVILARKHAKPDQLLAALPEKTLVKPAS